ncbi:MAG: cytochrome b/b6 domain-containing protein [Caldilineaceae bacterium]
MSKATETFERFTLNTRIQHALLIISFVILSVTGIPQKYSALGWAQGMVAAMGGIELTRVIHRTSAAVLIAVSVYHLLVVLLGLLRGGGSMGLWPRVKDVRDVFQNIGYYLGLRKSRPRFGRFTYMEKFEYWALVWGTLVMIGSGLILWFPIFATNQFPGIVVPSAKELHGNEAMLAIFAIILWHMYNAHFNPRVFPMNNSMFSGRIGKHEMMLEHAEEYEQRTGERVADDVLAEKARYPWHVITVSSAAGVLLVALYGLMLFWIVEPPAPDLSGQLDARFQRQVLLPPQAVDEEPAAASVNWRNAIAPMPAAEFGVNGTQGESVKVSPLQSVQFADSSEGAITSWFWQFGDGKSSAEQNPSHVFLFCPGPENRCTVTLTVCGPGGCNVNQKAGFVQLVSGGEATARQQ